MTARPLRRDEWTGSMGGMSADELYHERVRRLRLERGLSIDRLGKRTKVSGETLKALERPPDSNRSRYPSTETLEDVAQALGVDPSEFPEYRLAKARELLDERANPEGLAGALAVLDQITDALRAAATRSATAAERRVRTDLLLLASPGEAATPPGVQQRGPART